MRKKSTSRYASQVLSLASGSILADKRENDSALDECVRILDAGGIVALPTETVYGIVARADREDAIQRLKKIKGRPDNKPFALFVREWNDLSPRWAPHKPQAQALTQRFWPGPLTLVVNAASDCPAAYEGAVGARAPDHTFVNELLQRCGGLLVNTSLNRSGDPPASSLNGLADLLKELDLTIDAGDLPHRLPSVVVDCQGDSPRLLREGEISFYAIEEVWQASAPNTDGERT